MKLLKELLSFKLPDGFADLSVSGVSDNSKNISAGGMFIAVSGSTGNGERYISEAIANGAKYIVLKSDKGHQYIEKKNDIIFIYVRDVRSELSRIASIFWESQFKRVIAVTGTNGKTSTVDIVRQIINSAGCNAASIGTLGVITKNDCFKFRTQLTCPGAIELHTILNKLSLNGVDSIAIEASSHGIDQCRLKDMKFDVCAFTNLSQDHLDYHKTMENYKSSKLKLFSEFATSKSIFVINSDDEFSSEISAVASQRKVRCIDYGYSGRDVRIKHVENNRNAQLISVDFFGNDITLSLPLRGRFQVYNSLCAAASCYVTGIPIEEIVFGLENIKSINGRLEFVACYNSANIYIDYAHTPDALKKAILALRENTAGRMITLFGCGGNRDQQKRKIMGKVADENSDIVIVTDDNPRNEDPEEIREMIMSGCPKALEVENREDAINYAINMLLPGDTLLIAGKGHENYQLINGQELFFSDKDAVLKKVKR